MTETPARQYPARLYIAIRPNQANVARRLAAADRARGEQASILFLIPQDRVGDWSQPFADDEHVICRPRTSPDGAIKSNGWEQFEAITIAENIAAKHTNGVQLMLPHADDHLPALIHGNMAANHSDRLHGFERFYEGLGSYTFDSATHDWGKRINSLLPRDGNPAFYANSFIGVTEYDAMFNRASDPLALAITDIFTQADDAEAEAAIPAFRAMREGKLPKAVFAGQTFSSDGVTSPAYETAMTKALLHSGKIGFVARHPRNTLLPDSNRIGTTPGGLERYLGYMKRHGIALASVFSSTAYAACAMGVESRVVHIPDSQFCADTSHPKAAGHIALYRDIKTRLPDNPIHLDAQARLVDAPSAPDRRS